MSDAVIIEIDLDEGTIMIEPEGGHRYIYNDWEVANDVVDRLIGGGADYTVYSQTQVLREEDLSREEILEATRGGKE